MNSEVDCDFNGFFATRRGNQGNSGGLLPVGKRCEELFAEVNKDELHRQAELPNSHG